MYVRTRGRHWTQRVRLRIFLSHAASPTSHTHDIRNLFFSRIRTGSRLLFRFDSPLTSCPSIPTSALSHPLTPPFLYSTVTLIAQRSQPSMSTTQAAAWPSQGAPSLSSSSPSSSTSSSSNTTARVPAQPAATAVPQGHGRQPWSLLSALSISMYQSLSFSRSPSFERTRYIASTCTFIAIIYLRTLHCLFFGTGALSCAVLGESSLDVLCSVSKIGKQSMEKQERGGGACSCKPLLVAHAPSFNHGPLTGVTTRWESKKKAPQQPTQAIIARIGTSEPEGRRLWAEKSQDMQTLRKEHRLAHGCSFQGCCRSITPRRSVKADHRCHG